MDVTTAPDATIPHRIAAPGRIATTWPTDAPELLRLTVNHPVTVAVVAATAKSVALAYNVNGKWHEFPGRQTAPSTFEIELIAPSPGCFSACVCAEFADGTFWDHSGPMPLVVDPSWIDNTRMYTMIPTASGSISDWTNHLDEIESLGYNAIHLLPVTQMGSGASPYAAADFFHVDPRYADPKVEGSADQQFNDFLIEMQSRGLKLCIDLVFNHVGLEGTIIDEHPDWIIPDFDETDGFKRAGWWCGPEWMKWDDVVLLNFDHWHPPTRHALWQHMVDYALHWAEFASRTGGLIRLDNLHSTHPALLKHLLLEIRKKFPNLGILAELFTDQQSIDELVREHALNLLLATPWEHHFTPDLRWFFKELHSRMPRVKHYIPVASHDSGSPAQMYGNPLATIPRHALSTLFGLGASGSVQGMEYGLPKGIPFIGFTEFGHASENPDYRLHVKTLNRLHATVSELRQPGNLRFVDGDNHAVLAALRGPLENENLLVAANMDLSSPHHIDLTWLAPSGWTDLISGEQLTLDEAWLKIPEAGYRVLKRT